MQSRTEAPHKVESSLFETGEYRVEGRAKVTGQAQFTADFLRPGTLWAAFVSSTVPHARIVSVEVSKAKALRGVHAVLTGADIPGRYLGRVLMDWPVLAHDKVYFIGQYVAAVAAETLEIAEQAARMIVVEYEQLPAIFDPQEALAPNTPPIHEHRSRYRFLSDVPLDEHSHPNIQGRVVVTRGDVDSAFASASRVFEHTFSTPSYHGGYIEPHATLVWIDEAGTTRIVSTSKTPFRLRRELAACAGVPIESIIVEQCYIGGDFGAKGLSIDDFPCYFLAKATGRPVKSVRSYLDDIRSTNIRHSAEITIKSGIDQHGIIVALSTQAVFNGGAFAAAKPVRTLVPGEHWWNSPYRVENVYVDATVAYTNTAPAGHVRSPGGFQVVFAVESHLDMVAQALGIDPIDFRLRNVWRRDEPEGSECPFIEPRAKDVLELLRDAGAWNGPLPAGRGKGVAIYAHHIGYGTAEVRMTLAIDGMIVIHTPLMDQGVGALTMLQRTAAQTLGIGIDWFSFVQEDSNSALAELGPGATRTTAVTGRACQDAAGKIRSELMRHGWDGREGSYRDHARRLCSDQWSFEVIGKFTRTHKDEPDSYNFSGFMIDLSVDVETGQITVHDVLYVNDVGTVINPTAHRGQLNGGFVFGEGHALMEKLHMVDGRIMNLSFADYKVPTANDLLPFRTILLPTPGGPGPYGAKAAGESSTEGVAPALANAIARACGVRIQTLPLTGERIFASLSRDAPR